MKYSISKQTVTITKIVDLTPTAKELTLSLETQLAFAAGSFINLFIECDGEVARRAYSISSSDSRQHQVTITVRRNTVGKVSNYFWTNDCLGKTVEVMGPLGLNTVNKMANSTVYLFGFGIGAGVVKSLADHLTARPETEQVCIMLASKTSDDLIYQSYFTDLCSLHSKVSVQYVLSRDQHTDHLHGYIHDHIDHLDFSNSDVYVCGQESACDSLVEKIEIRDPINTTYLVEGFH